MNKVKEQDVSHITVFLQEAVEGLKTNVGGCFIDGTFGRGGHSKLILNKLAENDRLIALDRDIQAVEAAKKIQDKRFQIFHSQFSKLKQIVIQEGLLGKVSGVLLDLGVSSPQLDEADRGFSFMQDGPLDMRMDTTQKRTAESWINNAEAKEIAWVLKFYGEERFANRIANKIIEARNIRRIRTTGELANIIKSTIPSKEKHKHPATRSFQAIRIFVNDELKELENLLQDSLDILAIGGRLVVISFHSLEDRIVKRFIKQQHKGIEVPKGMPLRDFEINRQQKLQPIGKALKSSDQETLLNIRSRSAILRIAERI